MNGRTLEAGLEDDRSITVMSWVYRGQWRSWGVTTMALPVQPNAPSPLFFHITSVCFALCTRAESTAVSPLFTVCVTLSGNRWAVDER